MFFLNTNEMRLLAAKVRRDIVKMIGVGQTGHLGGSCSSADIVSVLYGGRMRFDPKNPQWEDRDRLIYSKGHAAIAQYAAMAEVGFFPMEELWTVKTLGSRLQGHPDRLRTPGIEAGTGSLGQGLSIACGMALAVRLDKKPGKVYCVVGDGEIAEGQIWEAAMAAAFYRVDNLICILDRNRLQAMGTVEERFDTNPLAEKWESFGWSVTEIDGHDVDAILAAFEKAGKTEGKPSIVIANTIKGKGISFAENVPGFHNGAMTGEQYEQALEELNSQIALLETEAAL